jgi:tRNA dimethylallyltransferase
LEEEAKIHGKEYLYDKLSKIDPISASKIKPNDLRRIIRALEVFKSTGKTISYLQKKASAKKTKFKYHVIGLKRNRENLYQRINLQHGRGYRFNKDRDPALCQKTNDLV